MVGDKLIFSVDNGQQRLGFYSAKNKIVLPLHQPIHVAGTLDGLTGALQIYINDVLRRGDDNKYSTVSADLQLNFRHCLGLVLSECSLSHGSSNNSPQYFPGLIDDVRLSDVALSSVRFLQLLPLACRAGPSTSTRTRTAGSIPASFPRRPTQNGNYAFTNLVAGTYTVAEVPQPGWNQTAPADRNYQVTVGAGQVVTGIDFGNQQ